MLNAVRATTCAVVLLSFLSAKEPSLAASEAPPLAPPINRTPVQPVNVEDRQVQSANIEELQSLEGVADPFQKLIYSSVEKALQNDIEMKSIDDALSELKKDKKPDKPMTPDQMVDYKGLNTVRDSAASLLGKDAPASIAGLELSSEIKLDKKYLYVLSLYTQIISEMGKDDFANSPPYLSARAQLSQLIGDNASIEATKKLIALRRQLLRRTPDYSGSPMSPLDYDSRRALLLSSAIAQDEVTEKLTAKLEPLSKDQPVGMRKRLSKGLNILSWVPGGFGMVASVAGAACDLTAGSDEAKILYSIYTSKRLESRRQVIDTAADTALHSYEVAQLTKNPFLLAFSLSLMTELSDRNLVAQIAGNNAGFWTPPRTEASTDK